MLASRRVLTVARSTVARRSLSTAKEDITSSASKKYFGDLHQLEHHGQENGETWRKISNYFFIPAIIAASVWVWQLEEEHNAHLDHSIHENGGTFPFPPAYEYMNFRVKPFPWGNNNLFYNPRVNPNLEEDKEEEE